MKLSDEDIVRIAKDRPRPLMFWQYLISRIFKKKR